ncbi:hypothetical protein RRG08_003541 [Elysia crispata]|uniref:Uncharacterized protein n=1 Tax=Elysia crispata TaxID=231223 RepID=A0AAE1CTN1_9GAST|nr:hypothetical protein RRG08_003541 [Elysia crispata]
MHAQYCTLRGAAQEDGPDGIPRSGPPIVQAYCPTWRSVLNTVTAGCARVSMGTMLAIVARWKTGLLFWFLRPARTDCVERTELETSSKIPLAQASILLAALVRNSRTLDINFMDLLRPRASTV